MANSNLSRIQRLKDYSNVGYSDHSNPSVDGTFASKAAIYLGASLIERHFSILSPGMTKDGPVSVSPQRLMTLLDFQGFLQVINSLS